MLKVSGVVLAVIIACLSSILASKLEYIEGVTWAIIIGMIVGNLFSLGTKFQAGINYTEKNILTYAIVLLGLNLNLLELEKMGWHTFAIILPTLIATILLGVFISLVSRFPLKLVLLLSIGNAVCGASAIAAAAPVIKADDDEIGVSIGIVNLLGTICIFVLPGLAHFLTLDQTQSSYLLGGVIQAVGQVVASGYSVSTLVGDNAVLIKMLRVLMIGPVVLVLSYLFRQHDNTEPGTAKKKTSFAQVPAYIIGFIICSILGTIFCDDQTLLPAFKFIGKCLLVTAMAGIGLKIKVRELARFGAGAFIIGALINVLQIIFIVILIEILG